MSSRVSRIARNSRFRLEAGPWMRTGLGAEIVLAGMEGKFVEETEAKGIASSEAHLTHAQAAWRASETIVSRIDSASALASSLGRPGARMSPMRFKGSSGNPSARPRTLRPGPTTEAGRIVAANPARNTVPMALKFLE